MDETAQGGAPAAPAEPKDPADPIARAPQPEEEVAAPIVQPAMRLPDPDVLLSMDAGDFSPAETTEMIAAPEPSVAALSPAARGPAEYALDAPALPVASETPPDLAAAAESVIVEPEPVELRGAVPAVAGPIAPEPAVREELDPCPSAERIEAVEHFQEYFEAPSDTQARGEVAQVDPGDRQDEAEQSAASGQAPPKYDRAGGPQPAVATAPAPPGGVAAETPGDVTTESSDPLAVNAEAGHWAALPKQRLPDWDAQADTVSVGAMPATTGSGPSGDRPASFEAVAAWGQSPSDAAPSDAARRALPYVRRVLWGAGAVAAGLVVAVLVLAVAYRWVNPPISTLMLGQSLAGTSIERTWVPIERISPNLIRAVVLSEDAGFCRHGGVDWAAIEEALEGDRGGSTITMQVVKNLFLWPSRSYVRKAIEIGLAYLVESLWPKQRIMEIYLNIAEWGDGVFGAEAAARAHFDKRASRLTAQEAALLAVALPNPVERTPAAPSLGTGRLASRLMQRMTTSRVDLSCLPVPRTPPRKAPLVPGARLTL